MANSYNTYVANGSQTAFLVTFEQRVFTQIQVYLNSELQTSGYTYNSVTKQIVFDTAPLAGVIVRLQRYTSETLLNKFGQDAAFTGSNLDENFEQILFKAEETQEAWLAPLDRAVRVPNSEVSINALPNVANRRNKALGFDSNGQPFMIPLVNIPDSALAIALAMADGGKWIGTLGGGTFLDRQDTVCLSEFTNNTGYASTAAAVQACFDYAKANHKTVDARGWVGTVDSTVLMDGIEVVGGTWNGKADIRLLDSTFRDFKASTVRVCYWGGKVRISDYEFTGAPSNSKVASILFQGNIAGGSYVIENGIHRNGKFGILQQGTGEAIENGVIRNIAMMNMLGDGIEMNVINKHYDGGLLIENIYLEDLDGTTAPIPLSNWGIGIGIAGQGPFGWDAAETQYAKNVVVRNVHAPRGVRQVVHFEVTRDSVCENVFCNPDLAVSTGTGLTAAGVITYGCKRMTIDGVAGEPINTGAISPNAIRLVMLEWGANQAGAGGTPGAACPSFDMTVRNVQTRTGRFYAGVGSDDTNNNTYHLENIHCHTMSLFGVATLLNMTNVTGVVFNAVGDDSSGGTPSNGLYPRKKTVLNMVNVNFYGPGMTEGALYSKARYSDISTLNSNVRTIPYTNIQGNVGVILSPVNRMYTLPNNLATLTGGEFPTGKEFCEGTVLFKTDGSGGNFIVTGFGAYIPNDGNNFKVRAAAAGQTYLEQNLTPAGTQASTSWLYHKPISAGTRLQVPGAGAGGAPLTVTVVRAPYQVDNNIGNPVRIDISPALVTAIPAGTQLAATYPVTYI